MIIWPGINVKSFLIVIAMSYLTLTISSQVSDHTEHLDQPDHSDHFDWSKETYQKKWVRIRIDILCLAKKKNVKKLFQMKIMHLINLKTIVPGENHAVRRRAPLQQVRHRPPQHQRWVLKQQQQCSAFENNIFQSPWPSFILIRSHQMAGISFFHQVRPAYGWLPAIRGGRRPSKLQVPTANLPKSLWDWEVFQRNETIFIQAS